MASQQRAWPNAARLHKLASGAVDDAFMDDAFMELRRAGVRVDDAFMELRRAGVRVCPVAIPSGSHIMEPFDSAFQERESTSRCTTRLLAGSPIAPTRHAVPVYAPRSHTCMPSSCLSLPLSHRVVVIAVASFVEIAKIQKTLCGCVISPATKQIPNQILAAACDCRGGQVRAPTY